MRLINTEICHTLRSNQAGVTLIETLIALALLGLIAVGFLSGLFTTIKATVAADGQTTAASLARSQMEYVQGLEYVYDAAEYPAAPLPSGGDYADYSVTVSAQPLHEADDGIQKITVVIQHREEPVMTIEGYKVNR